MSNKKFLMVLSCTLACAALVIQMLTLSREAKAEPWGTTQERHEISCAYAPGGGVGTAIRYLCRKGGDRFQCFPAGGIVWDLSGCRGHLPWH